MLRSEINKEIKWSIDLLEKNNIKLPRFAYWSPEDWRKNKDACKTVIEVMSGWDITDYGTGRYDEIGCVLFTVRNGNLYKPGVGCPYCEKYLLFKEGQRLPVHYHALKTEDIINRAGGGDMEVVLYNMGDDGKPDLKTDVTYYSDGIKETAKAGEPFLITTGNSITLTPHVFHTFGVKAGSGDLICGEVSTINDDEKDNFWAEPTARFADITEDEEILFPLCNELEKILS